MIRKSTKRKETEVDFEDKKMNLTLSQDEIDKEILQGFDCSWLNCVNTATKSYYGLDPPPLNN
jgi:hypothetical protein